MKNEGFLKKTSMKNTLQTDRTVKKQNTGNIRGLISCVTVICLFIFPNMIMFCESYKHPGIESAYDPMPSKIDFFKGEFSERNYSLSVNQTENIYFSISPIADAGDTTIRFVLPYGVELIDGKTVWNGNVKKDEVLRLSITIKPTEEIKGDIEANVNTLKNGIEITQSYYASIYAYDSSAEDAQAPPAGTLGNTVESASVQTVPTQISSSSSLATTSSSNIIVVGKMSYDIGNGNSRPVRYATVVLVDNETAGEEEVAISHTNANGEYYFNVDNNDGNLEGGRDVFVRVECESSAAKTVDGNEYLYVTTTPLVENVEDGTTVDFGSNVIVSDSAAWEAMDSAIDEYQWIDDRVDWTRPQITIRYPYGTWPRHYIKYYTSSGEIVYESIDLPLKSSIALGWNSITIFHEYGHAVMLSAYGYNAYNMPPSEHRGESHYIFDEKDEGFAITEGWAEFMQAAVANNPNALADVGQNIKNNDWFNYIDDNDMDGDIIEGSVASILWDIFDEANDDNINEDFDEIWSIMQNENPDDINEFWTYWFSTSDNTPINYGYDSQLWTIYNTYGIRMPDTVYPASRVNPLPSNTSTASFTVSWTGSDSLSGIKWYDIQYKDGASGVWIDWRQETTLTSDIFTGEGGHTYYFRSRAVDNADNVEAYPSNPEYDTFTSIDPGTEANETTTGTIAETHTNNSITVTATYSGDSDNDGSATLSYKQSSSTFWMSAGSMTKSTGQYTKTITGLAENTSYDVKVDYSDSDSVIGTNPAIKYSITTDSSINPYDMNQDYIIQIGEMMNAIDDWKTGNLPIGDMMQIIDYWKSGVPYS